MRRDLRNMVVAITGASSGIGRALAVELGRRGARLALAARRLPQLEELNRELGGGHLIKRTDVAVEEDCRVFVTATYEHYGRLDTLVCNAGSAVFRSIAQTTAEDWKQMLAVNLLGTTSCIQAAVPLMRAQELTHGWRGQIMLVSSCLARRSAPDLGAYSATKAAQLSVAEALRIEEGGNGIAVTSVHPVGTNTEFDAVALAGGGQQAVPRGRFEVVQEASDVARAMISAIEKPRPEVWPQRASRWAFSLATLMPGMADSAMRRFRRRFS